MRSRAGRGVERAPCGAVVVIMPPPPRSRSALSSAVWPVSARNTSSRLGWPSEKSAICTPERASSATASAARSASAHGADSAAGSGSRWTAPSSRRSTRSASGRCSGSSSRTCSAPPPTDALSWAGVPSAITRPWSITAMPSASWSASSRYCVQSRIVVPAAGQRAHDVPHLVARARVQAGRRLVEEHQLRRHDEAGRDVEPAPHAARVVLDEPAGRLGRGRTPRAARRRASWRRRAAGPAGGRAGSGSRGR